MAARHISHLATLHSAQTVLLGSSTCDGTQQKLSENTLIHILSTLHRCYLRLNYCSIVRYLSPRRPPSTGPRSRCRRRYPPARCSCPRTAPGWAPSTPSPPETEPAAFSASSQPFWSCADWPPLVFSSRIQVLCDDLCDPLSWWDYL